MKIGFFGDGPWAHRSFDKLVSDETIKIDFVCARNDAPDPILEEKSNKKHIDFLVSKNINSEEFLDLMKTYNSDLFVSMSFNQIFKTQLLNYPKFKTINCHAGKLPYYRGRNVLNWALINDEKEFGITTHYVDSGIDTGDIILQNCIPITDEDCYASLLEKAYTGCEENLYKAVKLIQTGCVKRIKQKSIDKLGFYCSKREMGDEIIDWNQNSRDIFNFVRALSFPGPKALTTCKNEKIKINKVKYFPAAISNKGIVGAVVGVEDGGFYVKTEDTFIKVLEWSGYNKPRVGDRLK